ncbi:hypothetical protein MRX96_032051 [Rhipicephalus microplus]
MKARIENGVVYSPFSCTDIAFWSAYTAIEEALSRHVDRWHCVIARLWNDRQVRFHNSTEPVGRDVLLAIANLTLNICK